MADLNNILDGIEDGNEREEEENGILNEAGPVAALEREPSIPHALLEAERLREDRTLYRATPDGHFNDDDDDHGDEDDTAGCPEDAHYTLLKKMWTQERVSPELLPFRDEAQETMELHMELLQNQEETIETILESTNDDPSSSIGHLMASIYKMDADRVRYMWTDLHRIRLNKIEQHPVHMISMVDHMTDKERLYLKSYGELLERHFSRTILDHLPKDTWKRLDDKEMIDRPNMDQVVFCRVLDPVDINNYDASIIRGGGENSLDDDESDDEMKMQHFDQGSCIIARYSTVRSLVMQGKIEMLM